MHNYDSFKLASPPEGDLCPYCDMDEIRSIAMEQAKQKATEFNQQNPNLGQDELMYADDFFEDCHMELLSECRPCRNCYLDNHLDY